jgi:hypothetical protein
VRLNSATRPRPGDLKRGLECSAKLVISSVQWMTARTPSTTRFEKSQTRGAAQQKATKTFAAVRNIGRALATLGP